MLKRQSGVEIDLAQGSPEWLQWRGGHVGGSEAAIIKMGNDHLYSSPVMLWKLKTGRVSDEIIDPKQRERMDRGHRLEPVARERFIEESGIWVEPVVMEHPYYRFAGASMDGMSEDRLVLVEIKAPGKENHEIALSGNIPEPYYIQMQHQFGVTGAIEGYYVSYEPDNYEGRDQLVILAIKPNHTFIEDLFIREYEFMKCVTLDIPPDEAYESVVTQFSGVIQLGGYARSGKDTVGTILENLYGSKRFAYADYLKEMIIEMGLWNGKDKTKEQARPYMIGLGQAARHVYPDFWLKGIWNKTSGIIEAANSRGAHITDVRFVNEFSNGRRFSEEHGFNHRLFWIDRPGVLPSSEWEDMHSSHLRRLANVIIHNDVSFKKASGKEALQHAVIAALSANHGEVYASQFID